MPSIIGTGSHGLSVSIARGYKKLIDHDHARYLGSLVPAEGDLAYRPSHCLSLDQRRRPETFRTAMVTACRLPTRTTSRRPRVMPV